jgi:hypothetical protein
MTEKQVRAVAAEAVVHERTVWRWLSDPDRCTESVQVRIEAAMKKLKMNQAATTKTKPVIEPMHHNETRDAQRRIKSSQGTLRKPIEPSKPNEHRRKN